MGLEKINEYRKKRGLSIEELSEKSGVPIGTLSKINAGITKNPNLETVKAIAYALGITLDDLDDEPRSKAIKLSSKEIELLYNFNSLNEIGQNEATKRIEELTYIDKYIKKSKITEMPKKEDIPEHLILKAAHRLPNATEEDLQHDEDIMNDPDF